MNMKTETAKIKHLQYQDKSFSHDPDSQVFVSSNNPMLNQKNAYAT